MSADTSNQMTWNGIGPKENLIGTSLVVMQIDGRLRQQSCGFDESFCCSAGVQAYGHDLPACPEPRLFESGEVP